mmetsp:Transcript_48542/g.96771  ORF Transcript_48542/g.96771 Transcript_48542/m.96771 type:complete len:171 (-) Transcript_48542:330-842(-)
MKPAWDQLAAKYEGSEKVIVADVDCTASGEPLCSRFGVEGFPTIKYFNPPDEDGESYEGGRDFEELSEFAATLGPGCSSSTPEHCSEEQLAELKAVSEMPEAERTAELEALQANIKEIEAAHDKLLESLQAQYEKSNEAVDKAKKDAAPRIKLLKMASAKPAADALKDEV